MRITEFKNIAWKISSCHTYNGQWYARCFYKGRRDKAVKPCQCPITVEIRLLGLMKYLTVM